MSSQCVLIVDDDPVVTEALSLTLERGGRRTIVCSDIEAAEVALERFPVTHLVSDVQFSGEFGFEGLHFLERVRRIAPGCRVVLMTGNANPVLRSEGLKQGAAAVLSKPFDTDDLERALENTFDPLTDSEPYAILSIPTLEQILASDTLAVAFQPIVRLAADHTSTLGFEALTRVRGRWLTGGPAMLFDYAEKRSRLSDLNLATLARAIRAASELPESASVFINLDPLAFDRPDLPTAIETACTGAGIDPSRIVLEVTERSGFTNDLTVAGAFASLRDMGLRFALDDHGSAYSHLALIDRIRPAFVKVSHTFGSSFEQDHVKQRIVRHTVALARDFGCETILEGIETPDTARAAIAAGVPLAQGFHFGRPRAAAHWRTS
jgi:EAL domain-containing protein (putative c-di-GMP-specific phosphodiesterase class I)/ActR/RegA family two-component response regulator